MFFLYNICFLNLYYRGCSVRSQKNEEKEDLVDEDIVNIDSAYEIKPFLKNTIYIYNDRESRASLTDYPYTQPQEYWLKEVIVQIKDIIAIIGIDCEIKHKILSAKYYSFGNVKLAILKTNKGEIRIAEADDELRKSYAFKIRYGNYRAITGLNTLFYCELPEEKLPSKE